MKGKIFLSFFVVARLCFAQAHQSEPHSMPEMPGMQMQQEQAPAQAQNPAERTPPGAPATDLLQAVRKRPPMELRQFEEYALANSPTIRQAESAVQVSAGLARQAGLLPNPMIGYQGEQIRGGAYRGGEQGAYLQQTFVLGGKLGLRRNVYEQEKKEGEIEVQQRRYRILGDVDQQFYAALAAQRLVNLREQLMHIAEQAVTAAHQLANVGQADAPDVLQSEVEAEQAKLDYTAAQRFFLQQFAPLAAMAGRSELAPAPLKGNLESYPEVNPAAAIQQVIQNHPALKMAQQSVAVAEAQLRSARKESIPDLQVHAGMQSNFEPLGGGPYKPTGVQAFATVGITVPLFNRNQGNIRAGEAELGRAQAEVTRVRLALREAASPVLQDYLSAQEEAQRYRSEMIPRAAKAYEMYLAKYQQMASAYPQVLVSQRTLFQLQVSYVQVLARLWRDAMALRNYLLSDGLAGPSYSVVRDPVINLPNPSGPGAE